MKPTDLLATRKNRAIDAAILIAYSSDPSSPSPTCTRLSRSRMIQMSEAGSSSNSFTMSCPVRAVVGQWMRLKLSPGS